MLDHLKCGKDDVIIKCGDVIHVLQESAMGLWWIIFSFFNIFKSIKDIYLKRYVILRWAFSLLLNDYY